MFQFLEQANGFLLLPSTDLSTFRLFKGVTLAEAARGEAERHKASISNSINLS